MESTQQQTTQPEGDALDSSNNAVKLDAVNELLSTATDEQKTEPERVEPEPTVSEAVVELAETEKLPDSGESHKAIKPPKNLDELAVRLNVEVKDLYAIEFPDPETGESHTLGELKDLQATSSDLTGRELEIEERRVKQENEQVQSRKDLEEILKALPPEAIKPEILAKARAEREVYLERESVRVLDVIPEWENSETKRIDWKGIQDHMALYGYSASQVDNIADHQMIRYMRDNMRRMQLVDKALAKAKPVKKVAKSRSAKPAPKRTAQTANPDSSLNDQLAAIDNLIKK